MDLLIKIQNISPDFEVNCSNSGILKEIADNCPSFKVVFREIVDIHGNIRSYPIEYKDHRLKKLMSEIDRRYCHSFRTNVLDEVSSLAMNIRKIVHSAMSKKKNLKIYCSWR